MLSIGTLYRCSPTSHWQPSQSPDEPLGYCGTYVPWPLFYLTMTPTWKSNHGADDSILSGVSKHWAMVQQAAECEVSRGQVSQACSVFPGALHCVSPPAPTAASALPAVLGSHRSSNPSVNCAREKSRLHPQPDSPTDHKPPSRKICV